jgi:hypothetical protein
VKTPEQELYERLLTTEKTLTPTAPSEGSEVEKELTKNNPSKGVPVTIRNLFTHHDSHPIVLDYALLRSFGLEWFTWDTSTIWAEVHRNFKTEISEHNRNKIQAVKTLHVSSVPWDSWNVFEKIIQGLNNNVARWDIVQAPTIEQLFAGIDIIDNVRMEEFSSEVRRYMAAVVLNEDILFVPPPLDFIQLEVSQPYYVCLDCGSHELALYHDGLCTPCSKKVSPEQGLSLRPPQDILELGYGRNIELRLKFNPDPVEARWSEVSHLATDKVDLKESPEDVQVAKLLIARDYMNIRRRQLSEQLTALKSWLVAT